jgi:hypothetical protein
MNIYPRVPHIEPDYISPDVPVWDIHGRRDLRTARLRGQPEFMTMIDDDPTEFTSMINDSYLPGNLSQQWQRARRLSISTDKNKATKCLEIAQFLLENYKGQVDEEMIEETAIDLMPLPVMNIERIHKRLGLDTKKTAEHPKLLNRFQILKKEEAKI